MEASSPSSMGKATISSGLALEEVEEGGNVGGGAGSSSPLGGSGGWCWW